MTTLKELISIQKYTDLSDIEIIKAWFIDNNMESEGINLMAELSKSKFDKVYLQLKNAQTWIPIVPDVYESNKFMKNKVSKEEGKYLNKITQSFLLGLDLNDDLLNWAKINIPNINIPTVIFVPMVKWLKDKYKIEFADKVLL